jgi:hypothetical protein
MPIWSRKRVSARVVVEVSIKQHSLPAFANLRRRVTKTTPTVPRTAMRSFFVFLLIQFFLVLARPVPVSNKLSAKGSYPHPLVLLSFLVANAPFPLEAALVNPTEQGFIPRDVRANPATPL